MRRLPILILLLAAVLIVVVEGEQNAIARPLPHDSSSLLLRLAARTDADSADAAQPRDPFYGEMPAAIASIAPISEIPLTPRQPIWPAFQVIGKQQDASGWSVFITLAGDTHAPVWVLRQGESFYDHYQVATLQPPTLVIRRLGQATGKTFNIGKDES